MTKMNDEIWKIIRKINTIWTNTKKIDELGKHFHENMVAIVGSDKRRINGKKECIDHWKKCSEKKIYSWKEYDKEIQIFDGKFAIVTYSFHIDLESGGKRTIVNSTDMFSLIKEDNEWKVIYAVV